MRRIPACLALLAAASVCSVPMRQGVLAQARPVQEAEARAAERAAEKLRQEASLRALEERLAASGESRGRLAGEITELRRDGARFAAALVDGAARARAAEERVKELEGRLDTLAGSEAAIRGSLENRRDLIVEVLAALQRMGRRTGPALLVRSEDMLAAIRTAMLLGAVLPGLREETEMLAGDLAELVRLQRLSAADREAMRSEIETLAADRVRLAALVRARQDDAAAAEASLRGEKAKAEALGVDARTLRDLVDRLEGEAGAARREAEEVRRAAEAAAARIRERFAAAAGREPARLAAKVPFGEARGLLARPAAGSTLREFGAADGLGGASRGVAIGARARALVISPADASVVFAGPFRSFGRLLILNAGGGYYLLLAGMDQISVNVGQFVLAGEPVGQMGEAASTSAALSGVEGSGPVLYVEFRKDGGSIDPSPWWAKSQSEKVRG